VLGDHSAIHGDAARGVPFTDYPAGERVLDVFGATAYLVEKTDDRLNFENCFSSYRYLCCVPTGTTPPTERVRGIERSFDAELRAVAPGVLLPVGGAATRQVLASHPLPNTALRVDNAER